MISAIALLSACADPLSGLQRINDVDLSDNDPAAQALPSADEIARESFFDPGTVLDADAGGDSTQDAEQTVQAEPVLRGGLLGFLRRAAPMPQDPEIEIETDGVSLEDAQSETAALLVDPVPEPQNSETLELASLPDEASELPSVQADAPKRGGWLSRLTRAQPQAGTKARAKEPSDVPDVSYGTVLPYGQIARVCSAKRQPLGRKVAKSGASGYRLYDSNPRISGPRTFYITGFDDGCPRQLTAANVLLAAPSFYELLHYGPTGAHLPKGQTDKAYEKVKRQVCGTGRGKPCGAKMKQMERSAFFVNSYPNEDDNTSWSEHLVHDGRVVASAVKSNS